MDFKQQSKINSLHNEILILSNKINYRERLGISEVIIKPLREQMELYEEQLNKLEL